MTPALIIDINKVHPANPKIGAGVARRSLLFIHRDVIKMLASESGMARRDEHSERIVATKPIEGNHRQWFRWTRSLRSDVVQRLSERVSPAR